jgi:hypothetical protein
VSFSGIRSSYFLHQLFDVHNEDMLYNWMDRASMFIFKAGRPFKVAKEMHLAIVHALIDVCSKIKSFVANLSTSTSMCFSSRNSFIISASKFLFDHFSPCRKHYQGLPKP